MSDQGRPSRGPRRRPRQRRGRGELSAGAPDQRRREARARARRATPAPYAAGQDPVRHDRRPRRRGRGRGVSARLRRGAGGRSRQAARLLQAPRQGRGRRRKRRARRRRLLGRAPRAPRRTRSFTPTRAIRVSAGGPSCRAPRRPRSGPSMSRPTRRCASTRSPPKGGVDFAYGDAFPHDANFDLLNGVDFQKGCYVGQEVVSRMKHRGTGAQARGARQARGRRAAAGNAGARRRASGRDARLVVRPRGAGPPEARPGRGGEGRRPALARAASGSPWRGDGATQRSRASRAQRVAPIAPKAGLPRDGDGAGEGLHCAEFRRSGASPGSVRGRGGIDDRRGQRLRARGRGVCRRHRAHGRASGAAGLQLHRRAFRPLSQDP